MQWNLLCFFLPVARRKNRMNNTKKETAEPSRSSETVKKIHLKGNEKPFYLIPLIEQKSRVDYNIAMQLLRYMVFVWID